MAASAGLASSFALKTARIVGRERECDLIRNALTAPDQRARIFYFVAPAGVGKTRLLAEVERMAKQAETDACLVGMFDFFETELHSNSALEKRIVEKAKENLQLGDDAFPKYTAAREKYDREKRQLTTIEQANKLRRAVGKALIEDLNDLCRARGCKLVFCFDTLETLQNESERVQKIIEPLIRYQIIEARSWLAEYLPQLENAVVVMASRFKPGVQEYLQEAFEGMGEFSYNELGYLDKAGVEDFFQAMAERYVELAQELENGNDLEQAKQASKFAETFERYIPNAHNIHVLTKGWPLMLGFTCDLIVNRRPVPDAFLTSTPLLNQDEPSIAQAQESVQNELYGRVRETLGEGVKDALEYIALLRKGATAKLLALAAKEQEQEWSEKDCHDILVKLKEVSYTKPKTMNDELVMFLHDQLYDIMDESKLRQTLKDYGKILSAVIAYYDGTIQKANQEWQTAQDESERLKLRDQEFRLTAEQLYYKLLQKNIAGYHAYGDIFDRAILNRQLGLDMLVRDEMLRFFEPRLLAPEKRKEKRQDKNEVLDAGRIERGAAIRWVERLIASGNYEAAIRAARAFKADPELTEQPDPLFVPILTMWEGEAAAYLGKPEIAEPLALLNEAIKTFESRKTRAALNTEHLEKLHKRNLGRAYNNLAYVYGQRNEWDTAVENYHKAIRIFRDMRREEPHPDTLKNIADVGVRTFATVEHQHANALKNQANAYANKGSSLAALTLVQAAEKICLENDFGYLLALCTNTRALIEILAERPHRARAFAREARDLLLDLREGSEVRGIGLASTVRGRACRRILKLGIYGQEDAGKLFEEGKLALEEALKIFNDTNERPREPEAQNELGCLYRDWANLARQENEYANEIGEWEREAENHLDTALQLARDLGDVNGQADTQNDLAELRFNQNELEQALDLLAQSDQVIEKSYPSYLLLNKLRVPAKPRTSVYTLLGTNALLRGHIRLRQAFDAQGVLAHKDALNDAMRDYLLASAYYDRFGGDQEAKGLNAARTHTIFNRLLDSGLKTSDFEKLSRFIVKTQAAWHAKYPSFPKHTTFGDDFDKMFGLIK